MRTPLGSQMNRLWISRKKNGLAQKSVAGLLGIKSRSVVSEYEQGRLLPNLRTVLKLSAIYGTPVNELFAPLFAELEREVVTAKKKRFLSLTQRSIALPRHDEQQAQANSSD